MKKFIAAFLIIAVAICSVSALEGITLEAYGGAGIEFANASGFKAVRISDYYRYGSSEGSLLLPLGSMNGTGVLFTAHAGVRYEVIPNLNVLGELLVGFAGGGTYSYQFDLGAIYELPFQIISPKFHLGAGAKLGFISYSKGLGNAQVLAGTTPPVILEEGTIRTGDSISFSSMGLDITPIVDAKFEITEALSVGLDMGFQFTIFLKNAIEDTTQDKTISVDSRYFFKPQAGTLVPETFNPSVSVTGFKTNIHVLYKF